MKTRNYFKILMSLIATLAFVFNSCKYNATIDVIDPAPEVSKAICLLYPTSNNNTQGTVTFTMTDSGVHVIAEIDSLTPGKHGFHVHQKGDCSSPDGKSAGGHFNPEGKAHGSPSADVRHIGDLGNIEADSSGSVYKEFIDTKISLNGINSIIGRGVIVHAGEDDLKSQPTGNAGARVACGVIGIVETKE